MGGLTTTKFASSSSTPTPSPSPQLLLPPHHHHHLLPHTKEQQHHHYHPQQQQQHQGPKDSFPQAPKQRLKREDHPLDPAHHLLFSDWKVLVGPTDWKDYASGKEGADRYRLHNLPSCYFGPGVYELGLCWSQHRRIEEKDVVIVYVGHAESVRTRLQHYGRSGSHLEGGVASLPLLASGCEPCGESDIHGCRQDCSTGGNKIYSFPSSLNSKGGKQSPHLFTEAFVCGYSIVFRWTAVESKVMAEKVEAELLRMFDYAWNTGGNGVRRPHDAFVKVQVKMKKTPHRGRSTGLGRPKWLIFRIQRVRLALKGGKSAKLGEKVAGSMFPKFIRKCIGVSKEIIQKENQVQVYGGGPGILSENYSRNKVRAFPKNLLSDKKSSVGKKITAQSLAIRMQVKEPVCVSLSNSVTKICGVHVAEGLVCMTVPGKGKRRCSVHKGLRLPFQRGTNKTALGQSTSQIRYTSLRSPYETENKSCQAKSSMFCGVLLENGSRCMVPPNQGRMRCASHKGMRVKFK